MSRDEQHLAFVVATKDRPDDLRKMFASLAGQSRAVSQVVIVDASAEPVEAVAAEFPSLNVRYVRHLPPSAAKQRNAGVAAVEEGIGLIGFLDDDAVLEPDAVEKMLDFWQESPADLGGAAFNMRNPIGTSLTWLKRSMLAERLGLYGRKTGSVMPSGWQTNYDTVKQTADVQWLPSGAVVWRREVFQEFRFDEFFDGYSYCEDLDFSYSVGRKYRLAVVADACYYHYPSPSGRISAYRFGRIEARNRRYFVRKHGLSLGRFHFAMGIRLALTLGSFVTSLRFAYLQRALGNIVGLASS